MSNIFSKRIPTIFGMLAIVFGIGITAFLTNQGVNFTGHASPSDEPQNILVSNVSDTSFTVSYTTSGSVLGSLNVGQNTALGTTVLDDRDKTPTAHTIHVMTVKNLNPSSAYFFSITSGQNTYLNNGVLFNTKTSPLFGTTPNQQGSITGKIILPDGTTPKEAILYINIAGAQSLSTITNGDGTYTLPLTSVKSSDLQGFYKIPKGANVKISVFGDSLTSEAALSSDQLSDVPTITLSQNYDFKIGNLPINQTQTSTPSAEVSFPTATPSSSLNTSPQILTPKKDQGFSDDQPLFKGTAQPKEEVEITIHSDNAINTTVTADANGNWAYRPDSSLSPGTHTISITTRDQFGILKTITQQFTVYASGSQVNSSATPSATLTPSATPTATPTVTPVTILTPVATQAPTETIIPTDIPTVSPTSALPATGSSSLPTIGIFAIVLIAFGMLLFIFTRVGI